MKLKSLLLGMAFTTFATTSVMGQTLPEPQVSAQEKGGWFDTFVATWWQSPNVPYSLELVNPSAVTVTKNKVETLPCSVSLTAFQLTESTPEYEDSRLVISLGDLQMDGGVYDLEIPAGTVNVMTGGNAIPNKAVNYSYTLKKVERPQGLPAPTISPLPGIVESLETVNLSWKGFEVHCQVTPLGDPRAEVTMTVNGGEPQVVETEYAGNPSFALSDYFKSIQLNVNAVTPGEYVITVPKDFLFIANENDGTMELDEPLVLKYIVEGDAPAAGSTINFVVNGDASGLVITDEAGNEVNVADGKASVTFDGSVTLTFSIPDTQSLFIWTEDELEDGAMTYVEIPEEELIEGLYMLRYLFTPAIEDATVRIDIEGEGPGFNPGDGYAYFTLDAPDGFDQKSLTVIYTAFDQEFEFENNALTFTWLRLPATILYKCADEYTVELEIPSVLQENVNYQTGTMVYTREGDNKLPETYNSLTLLDMEDGLTFNFVVEVNSNSSVGTLMTEDAEAVYYSIDGRKVTNPEPGMLLIKVCGGKVEKIFK